MTSNPNDPFDGLRPSAVPAPLRERVLDAARQAALEGPAPTVWDRLFESRSLRAAWGALCLVLVAGHFALTEPVESRLPEARLLVDAPELREVLELPRYEGPNLGPDLFDPQPAPRPVPVEGATSEEGVPS
jgi:hypothetical protein